MKTKIAISLDQSLLNLIDSKVDKNIIRSRSQAIEIFLRRGLTNQTITTAVILLKGEHQKQSLKLHNGKAIIEQQLSLFKKSNITKVYIVTQKTMNTTDFLNKIAESGLDCEVITQNVKGNAQALHVLKEKIKESFIVMSGDIFNDADLMRMSQKHLKTDKMATMALMTRGNTKKYGTAILESDLVIDFQEKPKTSPTHIVNAGIYIFKPEVFQLFENVKSLENDLFPKLAKLKQLVGFFTYGEYVHVG